MIADFIRLLKAHRVEAGLSQNQLSLHAGYDPSYVWQIEAGRHARPSRETVLAFAAVLELTQDRTDRLLFAAGFATETDYQSLWEAEHGPYEDRRKWCYGCQDFRLVKEFSKDRSRRDGLRPLCAACDATQRKEYRKRVALRGRKGAA